MADGSTRTIVRREDHQEPDWWTRQIELDVDLQPEDTVVVSRLTIEKNAKAHGAPVLVLDGEAVARVRGIIDAAAGPSAA